MKIKQLLIRENSTIARKRWPSEINALHLRSLRSLTDRHRFSVSLGDLILLENGWYVTHTGLIRLARRGRCSGIHVEPDQSFSRPDAGRWAFKATVYRSSTCKGFVGYGDADPSNVSTLVRGAEMRVAETRAVNRALRKAYGIGICSVEELGSSSEPATSSGGSKKLPQPANGNGNYGGRSVRDRLCQLIRQHQLDANLVKAYAVEFCGTPTLREASREQVENFVAHLADRAEKDRDALLCQLNSYPGSKVRCSVTRRFQGLNQIAQTASGEFPDGLYLVRIERGDDADENLITLCSSCHSDVHS